MNEHGKLIQDLLREIDTPNFNFGTWNEHFQRPHSSTNWREIYSSPPGKKKEDPKTKKKKKISAKSRKVNRRK